MKYLALLVSLILASLGPARAHAENRQEWPEGIGPAPSPLRPREVERPGAADAAAMWKQLGAGSDCPHDYDALHYDITLEVDRVAGTLAAVTKVRFRSEVPNLTQIALTLRDLTVSAVDRGGNSLAFSQANDTLYVTLDSTLAVGDTLEIEVTYDGDPFSTSFGGFYIINVPPRTSFNLGVGIGVDPPSMGRAWFPGFDSPCDKATADFHVITNLPWMGVANGAFVSVDVDSGANEKVWHWSETHQIATYLMSISIAKYDVIPDSQYAWIEYYVHRDISDLAADTFVNVKNMMTTFINLFGAYPWDRFSYATTNYGDMEHQTCVFHDYDLVTGDTSFDDIVAHELGHQWWGDLVTYADWREIYLSEGFATYCEALSRESLYGTADYHAYVTNALFGQYLASAAGLTYPIYDPVNKWGTISYEKGGSVLHMLRHVMGDSLFFAGLGAYRAAHSEDVATTEDFRAAMESVYGSSLDWFYQEWIYSGGHPKYDWWWWTQPAGGAHEVRIRLTQTQTVGPIFDMPIDFKIVTASGDTTVVGVVDEATEELVFIIDEPATDVIFDPDDWLLDENTLNGTGVTPAVVSAVDHVELHPSTPNPARAETELAFHLPSTRAVTLEVYGVGGRLVKTLARDETMGPGEHRLHWSGRDEEGARVASGVYLYRLQAGDEIQTRRLTVIR